MVLTKPEPVKTVLTKLELVEMVHRNLVLTNPPKQVHVETALPNFEPVIDKKKNSIRLHSKKNYKPVKLNKIQKVIKTSLNYANQ